MITIADSPQPGYEATLHQRWVFAGLTLALFITSGPNAVWDLQPLINDTLVPLAFIDPLAHTAGEAFPTATVAKQAFTTDPVAFDSVGIMASYFLGYWLPSDSVRQLAAPMLSIPYPCAFGSAWGDTSSWVEPLTTLSGYRTILDTADGYGEVELPWGTAYGVLSLFERETWATINGPDTERVETSRRRFLKPGFPTDVGTAWTSFHFAPGETTGTLLGSGARYMDELYFTGLSENDGSAEQLEVLSGPGAEQFQWRGGPEKGRFQVLDMLGRAVIGGRYSSSRTVSISRLPPATYVLIIEDEKAKRIASKSFSH